MISSNPSKTNLVVPGSVQQKKGPPKKIRFAIWEWQSNQDPWETGQPPKWIKYPKEQSKIIEKAYKEKKEIVEVGDYVINFDSFLQIHKTEHWKVRPVRRTEMRQRAMRFCSELVTPRTFSRVTYTGEPTIVEMWLKKRKFNFKIDKNGENITDEKDMPQLKEVVALAIEGILKEGQENNWKDFAETLTKRLQESISNNPKSIFRECVYIYTEENKPNAPSLYSVANKALREIDYSKVETLGPYCYLLNFVLKALSHQKTKFFHSGKVYRGLGLEENMLEMYKKAWKRGLQISFHSFVSTSKSAEIATMFSFLQQNQRRVLLVIENLGGAYIEAFTSHPGEKEVLLPASRGFQITNIDESDPEMTTIYLKMVNTKLNTLHLDKELSSAILLSHSSFTELPPSLSRWEKDKKVYFEISGDGKNITPEDKSLELKEFVELAARGIRKFCDAKKKEKEGEYIADMLAGTMKNEPGEIFKTILGIFYKASFCREIHMNMRSENSEKLTDLGPFCYLLNSYLIAINKIPSPQSQKKAKFTKLYRVSDCPKSHLDVFKELYDKNLHLAFSSFTPATPIMVIAEHFARLRKGEAQEDGALFLTLSVPQTMVSAFDFSPIATSEKEILLPPNLSFKITEIDFSSKMPHMKLEFIDYII